MIYAIFGKSRKVIQIIINLMLLFLNIQDQIRLWTLSGRFQNQFRKIRQCNGSSAVFSNKFDEFN